MSELLREIEDDMRAARSQDLLARFGKTMVWVSVAVIAGTAAGVLWRDYKQSDYTKQTNILIAGTQRLEAGDYKEAIAAFDNVSSGNSAHYGMALLRKAEAEESSGDKAAAQATLKKLSAMSGDDIKIFTELAKLKLASSDVPADKNSPFYLSVKENQAWKLYEQGSKKEAVEIFAGIYHDQKVPPSMQQRVSLALQYMAPEKLEKKPSNE